MDRARLLLSQKTRSTWGLAKKILAGFRFVLFLSHPISLRPFSLFVNTGGPICEINLNCVSRPTTKSWSRASPGAQHAHHVAVLPKGAHLVAAALRRDVTLLPGRELRPLQAPCNQHISGSQQGSADTHTHTRRESLSSSFTFSQI